MRKLPVDYLTRDYEGFYEMMKQQIPLISPEWTDLRDDSEDMAILQTLAYGLHILSYYGEKGFQESILSTARTKTGVLSGCEFLGYKPERQKASRGTIKIFKNSDYLNRELVIPPNSKFSTDEEIDEPIIFETDELLVIPSGESFGVVTVTQGETISNEVLGISDGTGNQEFTFEYEDVLEESIFVYTEENGIVKEWELVDNFLESRPTDRHYTIGINEEDLTTIIFGDGILGQIPLLEETIYASYRIGGGSLGNLAPNLIINVYDEDLEEDLIESVTNEDWTQGGEDYEDLEVAKKNAPKHYRSREQAVTPTDFQDIAELTPGVSLAKCVETFKNDLFLYILDTERVGASPALCKTVKERIDSNRVGNVRVIVEPCTIQKFTISLTIFVHPQLNAEEVKSEVIESVNSYFNNSYFTFGTEFYASKSIDIAFNTTGVKNVIVDTVTTPDITNVGPTTVLKLESVNVTIGGTP